MRFNIHTQTPDEAALEAELRKLENSESPKRGDISDERRGLHNENRKLTTAALIGRLGAELPEAVRHAKIVGTWIWITFPGKPDAEVRGKLYDLGFHWNRKRKAWQHPCGAYSGPAKSDPTANYPVVPVRPAPVLPAADEEAVPARLPKLLRMRKAVAA